MLQRQFGGAFARQAGLNDDGVGPVFLHRGEGGLELLTAFDPDSVDRRSGGFAAQLDLFEERFGEGIGRIGQSGHSPRGWQQVADQLHAFASRFGGDASQPSDISARPRKARDQPQTDGVSGLGHHDRDFPRRLLCRHSGGREPSDDDIDLETNQLSCQFRNPVDLSFRRPKLKSNVLPLNIPQIVQSLPKLPPKLLRIDIANDQCADGRHLRLLCARRERPGCRTAEQRYELAPFLVDFALTLIASSARACHPASLSFIRATSVILPSATMRSACADASPARTSSTSSSAVNPFANISASVQPSGDAASSSRARRRSGLGPRRRRWGWGMELAGWRLGTWPLKDTTPRLKWRFTTWFRPHLRTGIGRMIAMLPLPSPPNPDAYNTI